MDKAFFLVTQFDLQDAARVAEQRLKDAQALLDTGKAQHANGALYLLGYVMEILLKAELVRQHPSRAARNHQPQDHIWRMIWKEHDWLKILQHPSLKPFESALIARGQRERTPHLNHLKRIGGRWTIEIRYSPAKIRLQEVRTYAKWIRQIKESLQ